MVAFIMATEKLVVVFLIIIFKELSAVLLWERMRCAPDPDQNMPEGLCDDIGRFPWMGIIQHTFYIGGKMRFAVTTGVLIHPSYALASAEDMARIHPENLANTTNFVLWNSKEVKYTLDVRDYTLHPEYVEGSSFATIALVELVNDGLVGYAEVGNPVLPICMTSSGAGTFNEMYAIKMTDVKGEVYKEAYKMSYVENQDCEEFYYKAKLTYTKMKPINPICAVVEAQTIPCVWDGGAALVTRQAWGYWKLLGFGIRGPGCGAPARFLYIHDYMDWIDAIVSFSQEDIEEGEEEHKIYFRRLSPVNLIMYKGDTKIPRYQGQCERKDRGSVLFKDSSEILVNKNFAQGFYFVTVSQLAAFACASVHVESMSRTNAAVWLEHHCHRDVTGLSPGMKGPDYSRIECFVYFKSKAFIEFRFYFSFRVVIEMTLYGTEEIPKYIPNPFHTTETTENWYPTNTIIRWKWWVPIRAYWNWM